MQVKAWIASIGYEQFIIQPEDVASLMYLSARLQKVSGYP